VAVAVLERINALRPTASRSVNFSLAVAAAAVLAVVCSGAAPTELALVDKLYIAGLAAMVAYFAGTARRWSWFLPAFVGGALASTGLGAALAAVSIGIGIWSVRTDSRTRARAAIVVGLGLAAALRAGPFLFHGSTAILTAAAIAPIVMSGYRRTGRRARKRTRRVAWAVGGLLLLISAGVALAGALVAEDLYKGAKRIDEGITAAQDADDDEAAIRMGEASQMLGSVSETLTSWFAYPARALPVVGPNLDAVEKMSSETSEAARVLSQAASSADVDALRFNNGRLDPEVVANVTATLADVSSSLGDTQVQVDQVGSPWLLAPIADRMDDLDGQLTDNLPDVDTALGASRIAEGLLGAESPRRYLVLFTTPVEARGRTGFPGNYAELVVDNGQLSMPKFGRISELEQGGTPGAQRTISGPPDFLARYGRFDPQGTWRNIVMSPDFPTIAKVAGELYPQSGGAPIDGVMSVDPSGLAALMDLLDLTIDVEGLPEPLTPDNTVQFLQFDQYVTYPETSQRVDLLEEVARTTFEALTHADMPRPKEAIDILDPAVDRGHIQFTTFDAQEAEYFDMIGISGLFEPAIGDFLSVVTSNAGASKIDLYLQRHLSYEVGWDPATGQVAAKATVTLQNTAPASGLPDYVIGNAVGLPWGTNRSFVSVYSAYRLDAARMDGQPLAMQSESELGRKVYSTFVDIPPGATVTLELDLQGQLAPGLGFYVFNAQPQPLANPEQAEVTLTVAGDLPLELDADDDVELSGRVIHWAGTFDTNRQIAMTAGDVQGALAAEAPAEGDDEAPEQTVPPTQPGG
jgi:hypothetical protein